MSKRAEQERKAKEYYDNNCICCSLSIVVETFLAGYKQAEKDLALTWEDIQTIDNIVVDMAHNTDWPLRGQEVFYTEVLNRFNKSKENNEKK